MNTIHAIDGIVAIASDLNPNFFKLSTIDDEMGGTGNWLVPKAKRYGLRIITNRTAPSVNVIK